MTVRLISYTSPAVELIEQGINDLSSLVAFCARVSNPDNQMNTETYNKLINYLVKHKHWSPFELVSVCLEVETTRDIGRQILRHRSFSFNEYSQRYADPTKDLTFEIREARLQDTKNRQNSIQLDLTEDKQRILAYQWEQMQQRVIDAAKDAYTWAVENGIAKEQARAVLPEGNTISRMYMNGTLRSWLHFIDVRTEEGVQQEHRDVAKACAEVISKIFPLIQEFNHANI